eukprot:TRINITY_DN88280_c0_g1_i1.p1 TRINITY_DN88280_c0_g1~~TRINITY_DN88280_c0_g1_i1.p1  ORF type:complete len:629 (+),score=81.13 TRINITY_DN88280_c0_g1_i1:47-1888(+)
MQQNEQNGKPETKTILFIHDILISYQSIYPVDLAPSAALAKAIGAFRGSTNLSDLQEILCNSPHSCEVFTNLFWLYFCLRFQRQAYLEFKREYKREIKDNYTALFYSLHQIKDEDKVFEKDIIRSRLRRIPIIYAWAIVKKFCSMFKKSIGEFTGKFVAKCCQVVFFELQGLCVTESFVINELKCLICDPLLYDIFPAYALQYKNNRLKPYKQVKLQPQHSVVKVEEQESSMEELPLETPAAIKAWKDYRKTTKHTKQFFEEQNQRVSSILNATQKRVDLLESRMSSLKALSSKVNLQTTRERFASQSTAIESPQVQQPQLEEYAKIPSEKTTEEVLFEDLPYSCTVRSSQLSPFMTKFAPKLFTGHDVAITAKLPDKRYMKGSKRLFQAYSAFIHKAETITTKNSNAQSTVKHFDYETIRKQKLDRNFEKWVKSVKLSEKAQEELDIAFKTLRTRTDARSELSTIDEKKVAQSVAIDMLDPDEKLQENTMFNSLFGCEISKNLQNLSQRQLAISKMNPKEKRGSTAGENNEFKLREIMNNLRGGKLRLMNTIKKIGSRYIDKKGLEEEKRKAKEKDDITKFVKRIKEGNKSIQNSLATMLSRTQKTLYRKQY